MANTKTLVSYRTLRRVIGILGVTLPLVLVARSGLLLDSISAYYDHEGARDFFVGVLFTAGFYLFCYKGYEKKDDTAGDVACLSALGVALFPASTMPVLHYLSAAVLFSTLSYFSLCLFTKTHDNGPPTAGKKNRNRVYRTCGWSMVVLMVLTVLFGAFHWVSDWRPVFWLEAALLAAFGVSWFVKGETLLKD